MRSLLSKIDDYPAYLEKCWQEHLVERKFDAPTIISTFAGCGGSSLGYSMAGFRELLAIEWNDNAVKTFKLNFPDVPVYHGDINKLTVEHCLELADIEQGKLDVLDGSPPCQGFSTAGKRKFRDVRNQLSYQFIRLLRGLKPKVFIMENVSGLVKGKMKLIFADILKELKASGYNVKVKMFNAIYFGVPQSRERLIFIGVREDLGIKPNHPEAEMEPITVRQAFRGLEDYCDRELPGILRRYARIHPDGKWSTDPKRYEIIKGNTASCFSLKWAQWNEPSGTLPKQEISLTGIIHPDKERYLNLSEAKRLGAFPDSFQFTDRQKGWRCIGNSVPPLMMRSIALHIREQIFDKMTGAEPELL